MTAESLREWACPRCRKAMGFGEQRCPACSRPLTPWEVEGRRIALRALDRATEELAQGRPVSAYEWVETALHVAGEWPEAYKRLGDLAYRLGHLAKADEYWRRARQTDSRGRHFQSSPPGVAEAQNALEQYSLALALFDEGRLSEAWQRLAPHLQGSAPPEFYLLAARLLASVDRRAARGWLARARRIAPDHLGLVLVEQELVGSRRRFRLRLSRHHLLFILVVPVLLIVWWLIRR